MVKPDDSISFQFGKFLLDFYQSKGLSIGPLVYGWKRNGIYLYIGMSHIGLERPFTENHNIIGKKKRIRKTDLIDIWYTKNPETLERKLILAYIPLYNKLRLKDIKLEIRNCIRCNNDYQTPINNLNLICNNCLDIKNKNIKWKKLSLESSKLKDSKEYQKYINGTL